MGVEAGARPSFLDVYMGFAFSLTRRATCRRLQVGAVITSTDFRYVYGLGYNGNAAGMANTCDRDVPGNCGCLHAECNAVTHCAAPRSEPKFVFVTHAPCAQCAKMLVNLGNVTHVYYYHPYRSTSGLEVFSSQYIPVRQLTPGEVTVLDPGHLHPLVVSPGESA